MKPILFTFILLTLMGQYALAQSINVMTWNIRYNNPGDGANAWPNRRDWVVEIILKNKADIAGFQEVLVGQLKDLKSTRLFPRTAKPGFRGWRGIVWSSAQPRTGRAVGRFTGGMGFGFSRRRSAAVQVAVG